MRPTLIRHTLMPDGSGGQLHLHLQLVAVRVEYLFDRQRVKIVDRIALLLPAIGIQRLLVIALLVQQADADQRAVRIARSLQMIAR